MTLPIPCAWEAILQWRYRKQSCAGRKRTFCQTPTTAKAKNTHTHTRVAFEPSRLFSSFIFQKVNKFLVVLLSTWPTLAQEQRRREHQEQQRPDALHRCFGNCEHTSMLCAAWASWTPGRKAKEEKEARRKSWSQLLGICENESIHYAQHSEISLWPSEGVHIFQMLTCAVSGQNFYVFSFASGQRKSVVWPSKRSDERSLKSRRGAEEKAISDEVQTDHRDLLEDLISQESETVHLFQYPEKVFWISDILEIERLGLVGCRRPC